MFIGPKLAHAFVRNKYMIFLIGGTVARRSFIRLFFYTVSYRPATRMPNYFKFYQLQHKLFSTDSHFKNYTYEDDAQVLTYQCYVYINKEFI